jgi:7,8-dihydroneopterin 2',3'-cyclic phosphate phosphodiesterase
MKQQLLNRKIRALAGRIHGDTIRKKVLELLENPTFTIDGKTYSGLPLDVSPAGLSHHHYYPGGYVEHVVSTARIALAICDSVEKVYRGKVNRDLVLAGVLLHDVFKPVTYTVNENGTYGFTRLADNLDHSSLAVCELVRRGFPIELVHIVASHHGDYSPVRPRTVEALICHLADLADSRLNGGVLDAAAYLTRRAVGQELPTLNSNEAFEIVYSKSVEGWEGVARSVENIRRKRKTHKI